MKCPNCGNEVPKNGKFCTTCGMKLFADAAMEYYDGRQNGDSYDNGQPYSEDYDAPTASVGGGRINYTVNATGNNSYQEGMTGRTVTSGGNSGNPYGGNQHGRNQYGGVQVDGNNRKPPRRFMIPLIAAMLGIFAVVCVMMVIFHPFERVNLQDESSTDLYKSEESAGKQSENGDKEIVAPNGDPSPTPTPTPLPTATPTPLPTATPTPLPTPTYTPVPISVVSAETISIYGGIQAPTSDFLFPESSSTYLSNDRMNQVLESSSAETMHALSQLAINELLARYGYPFTSSASTAQDARNKFGGTGWYKSAQSICPVNAGEWDVLRDNYFNSYERANFDALNEWQKSHGVYY